MAHRKRRSKPSTNLAGDAAIASHAYKRLDRMTLMGLIVPKLIAVAKISRPWFLDCQRATYQAGSGSLEEGTQAAHNLPADITLNGRSVWKYANEEAVIDAHARVQLQIEYSAAATVTVPRLANHLDSQWEKNGLIDAWLAYVRICVENAAGLGEGGPLNPGLRAAAAHFLRICSTTLENTVTKIEASEPFKKHQDALNSIFDIYAEKVDQYNAAGRLESMWRIYSSASYR